MSGRISLPIDVALPGIVGSLETGRCLVLEAEPGAGKTTRVPSALLDAGFRAREQEILVLEPRRLAAKMAARRVAEERGEEVGGSVGYQFRFENVSGPKTRLRFLTEGMLMRRLLGDPRLKAVAAVVLDEFHERHLHGDVALAFLRNLQLGARPDLRIVVMSATLASADIARFLGDATVMRVPGRMFDVVIEYVQGIRLGEKPLEALVRDAVVAQLSPERRAEAGDVLVFLPGMAEIRRAATALDAWAARESVDLVPLHGELSREEQDRAFRPSKRPKVILSTNVAETSLTIPGVRTVIDSGLARVASFSAWSGLPSLHTRAISRASAIQRAGRAGRMAPGRCIRLYSKGDFDGRPAFEVPEIGRADLAQTVLELKTLGVRDLPGFGWFEPPSAQALEGAERLLVRLGALEAESLELTADGRRMTELPTHPRLARLVLEAHARGALEAGAEIAALLGEGRMEGLDFLAEARRGGGGDPAVSKMRDRLISAVKKEGKQRPMAGGNWDVSAVLLTAFPDRVARRRDLGASVSRGATARTPQSELVFSSGGSALVVESPLVAAHEYFVAIDVEERKGLGDARSRVQVRSLCPIEPEWLFDLPGGFVRETEEMLWDAQRGRVEARYRMSYDQLVLDESRGKPKDVASASRRLAQAIRDALAPGSDPGRAGPALTEWIKREELDELLQRAALAREHFPRAGFPDWGQEGILASLETACDGRAALSELEASSSAGLLIGSLPHETARSLERLAPTHAGLAPGRRARIHYEPGKPPWIESRLQDFFGMGAGPSILDGRVPLTLHLLAPNQRAVQVTSDLAGFWKRVYPELRRELGRRYPRHAWPEDPLLG